MLAATFFVLATLLPRLDLEGIAFFFGSALLAVDCLSIAIPEPAHALVHSASAALMQSDGKIVLQAVNSSVAMYDASTGALEQGFPKGLQKFLHVPAPKPDGCDSGHADQPFLSDPRAARDPDTGHWYVAALQVEDAFGIGTHLANAGSASPITGFWQ